MCVINLWFLKHLFNELHNWVNKNIKLVPVKKEEYNMSRTAYCYQYIGSIRLGSIIEAHAHNLVAVDFEYAKLIVYYT